MLPLLLLLLFGIIEFGRVFGTELMITHCAREGARYGAVGADDSEIVSRVKTAGVVLDENLFTVVIDPAEGTRARGGEIGVSVRYPLTIVAPFISVITGETVTIESSCVMRVE